LERSKQNISVVSSKEIIFVHGINIEVLSCVDTDVIHIGDISEEQGSVESILFNTTIHPFYHQQIKIILYNIHEIIIANSCIRSIEIGVCSEQKGVGFHTRDVYFILISESIAQDVCVVR
jgi:hypothetical protein